MSSIFRKPPFNYQAYIGTTNYADVRFDSVTVTAPITGGNLHSVAIPANSLIQDGQIADVRTFYTVGAHAASSVTYLVLLNGGASIFSPISGTSPVGHGVETWMRFMRVSSSQILLFSIHLTAHTQSGITSTTLGVGGARNVLSNFNFAIDNVLQFQATDTVGTETITQEYTTVVVT